MKKFIIPIISLLQMLITGCKDSNTVVDPALPDNPEISVIIDASQNSNNPFTDEVKIDPTGLAILHRHSGTPVSSVYSIIV